MSPTFAADRQATFDDVAEACALLLPIAMKSIESHGWPPAVARWLLQMQAGIEVKNALERAIHGPGVWGETPCKRSAADPGFASVKRHVGTLDAAAAVRLPLRKSAP